MNHVVAELEKYRDGLMSTVEDKESEIQEYTRRLGEADAELKVVGRDFHSSRVMMITDLCMC